MSSAPGPLPLYDLFATHFSLGFSFPDYIDSYLSLLSVSDFQTTSDPNGILYTGTVFFPSTLLPQHKDPDGSIFDFLDPSFKFRLLFPRTGADIISAALSKIPSAVFPPSLEPLQDDVFGAPSSPPTGPTDFPGVAFQLELLLNVVTFHLGPNWLPAVQNSDGSISPNPGSPPHTDVRVLMPQILFRISLAEDFQQPPSFVVAAWGDPGFDAPNDLAEGQLATMDPPLAIHVSGRVAFGVQTIILDLSSNGAPPEILQYFGTDDSFKGLYIKAIQVYYTDTNKDFALNFLVQDALISFAGKVWLEAEVDLILDQFTVAMTAWDGSKQITVNPGTQVNPSVWHGGTLNIPQSGLIYLQIAGGIPPYTQSVTWYPVLSSPPSGGGTELWDNSVRSASLDAASPGDNGELLITVTDSTLPTPLKYTNRLQTTVTDADAATGTPPAAPAPPSNSKPPALRRLSIKLRLEMNTVVMAEISGEIDWTMIVHGLVPNGSPSSGADQLNPQGTPAATVQVSPPSPDCIIDFTLNVTYDLATGNLTETFALGAAPADINGLANLPIATDVSQATNVAANILGAVLILTPILSAATKALDPSAAGQWSEIAIDLGVPVIIGALGIIRTLGITLYGGSLQIRENIPSHDVTNAALTFDYGVQFGVEIDLLNIKTTKPLKVRYNAVGVSMLFGHPVDFQIVLDTSKGYSLDLSDPGLFNLPSPLGELLKIGAASIARYNPVTLEVDIVIKADLGIVTVDNFKVKVPLDGSGPPMITPSGVAVNIPETITGQGTVNIANGGFEGDLDVTLCPIGLRMVASIGVNGVPSPPVPPGTRTATAFYFGFELDFPAPILLGDTGLSLFGIFGLFGMHYDRLLSAPIPGDAVGPDLRWLLATKGQPYLIESEDGSTQFWTPKLGNWAFGVGAILGTSDGFLITMRGMFILELPGPRIIITVNLKFIVPLPGLSTDSMDTSGLDVGIIGILDLDFGAGQITLGVMIDFEITDLISVQIPIQLYFSWYDPSTWHFWIGTIQTPASANILGIIKGGGYFMIGGQPISPFPPGSNGSLPGVAVAMGIFASTIWGSESVGVYLKSSISANFGVSFSPKLFILGDVQLQGSLHLLIVDIGATGDFQLTAPNPVYLQVHVCGHVSMLFFSFSACVDFSIGSQPQMAPVPPPLITNLYLQSYAPVIAQGQGDQPIDASLGNAVVPSGSATPPVVPIDTVPVIQMLFGVDVSQVSSTFTQKLPPCPSYPGGAGVNLGGGNFAQYQITSLSINPPLPASYTTPPPVAWRPNKPSGNTSETQIDLGLFTRNPNVTTSALERSSQFTSSLSATWSETCTPVAPAACVFYAFCGQPLGPSPTGWTLYGIPTPDPPGTSRQTPVPVEMQVTQPALSAADALGVRFGLPLAGETLIPAGVLGAASTDEGKITCERAVRLPELLALNFSADLASGFTPTGTASGADPLSPIRNGIQKTAEASRWLRFATGQSKRIRILLSLGAELYKQLGVAAAASWVQIVEINPQGARTPHNLMSLHPVTVNSPSNLPSTWTAASSPWSRDVTWILTLLKAQASSLVEFIEFVPKADTTVIEINVSTPADVPASIVVGAIESCPTSEAQRVTNSTAIQQGTIQSITSYLSGGQPVPLLQPGTTYTITVNYNVIETPSGKAALPAQSQSQAFQFATSTAPPATLNAYVLCCSPDNGDTFFFYEDPVDVIFNDSSVFALFEAYGYQLTIDLRAADGLPEGSPSGALLTGSPSPLEAISGIGPATYDSMLGLAKKMPCITGSTSAYQNQKFTAPVYLRPLMGYTFDLVTIPATPQPSPPTAVQPLFRRNFATGRYANLQALAQAVLNTCIPGSPASGAIGVIHRPLKSALSFAPPASSPVSDAVFETDAAIQQAFLNSGEQALPAATQNTVALYWLLSANGNYVPHAILVDTIEPLWRWRNEPGFANPIPSDPSFEIVTISPAVSLEVKDTSAAPSIDHFVVSPGGTRTVAIFRGGFAPPATGADVTLSLHRPASLYYGNADEAAVMLQLTVTPLAPWESDHV